MPLRNEISLWRSKTGWVNTEFTFTARSIALASRMLCFSFRNLWTRFHTGTMDMLQSSQTAPFKLTKTWKLKKPQPLSHGSKNIKETLDLPKVHQRNKRSGLQKCYSGSFRYFSLISTIFSMKALQVFKMYENWESQSIFHFFFSFLLRLFFFYYYYYYTFSSYSSSPSF